jgi:hypothetical protein
MRRIVMLMCVAAAALGLSSVPAGAAPDTTAVFHFKGRAGSALLTDCSLSAPVGTHCRAVSVFAFEQRVNADGDKTATGPGVNVDLFDVTITDVEPFYVAEEIGFGFSDTGTVKINGNLSRGTASAVDVPLCDFGCAPGSPASISVSVEWSGFGPTSKFRSHFQANDPTCFFNDRATGSFRSANATGSVDGVTFVDPHLPGFEATLQADGSGSVSRCPV